MDTINRVGTVFSSKLGWFGVLWRGRSVERVTFGHSKKSDAQAELSSATLGPSQTDSAAKMVFVPTGRLSESQQDLTDRLRDYAAGAAADFSDISLEMPDATRFQRRVLEGCRAIAWGQTRTYGDLASHAGSPRAARAAGTVMANNRFPIIIPCHRVIPSNHKLGGFSAPGGVSMKRRLLEMEAG